MKTTAFGVCGLAIVTTVFVALLQVVGVDTRATNLQDTLYGAMETSLETALNNRAYTIDDDEALVADVVQGVALELGDSRAELSVQVNEVDRLLGIISMKMTAQYPSVSGKKSTVSVERTVVLEHTLKPALPGTRTVSFTGPEGNAFKSYTFTEGAQKMPYPNYSGGAGTTFLGWERDGVFYANDAAGKAAMQALTLDADYVFAARVHLEPPPEAPPVTKEDAVICITGSDESRPDEVFTYVGKAPLANQGWGTLVDKNNATTMDEFAGCAVMLFAGENLGVSAERYPLLMEWYNSGGRVLTTGNDAGGDSIHGVWLMPDILVSSGVVGANIPYAGATREDAMADFINPRFPKWTPSTNPALDSYATILQPVNGSACVAIMRNLGTCGALVQQNGSGGRWAHIHTKIGSITQPGDHALADAALAWLIAPYN